MSTRVRIFSCVFILAVLLIPVDASAQPTFTAGLKAGVNSSTIAVDPAPELDFTQLIGGVGGVFVGASWNGRFDLILEGLYSQRGTKVTTPGSHSGDMRFNYIDLPLLARVGTTSTAGGTRVHVFTGPQAGFRLDAKAKNEDGEELDIKDDTEDVDFGWTFGAGLEVKRFLLDARYTMGFRNMIRADSDETARNRTFTMMVGWRLK